jgi:hypothetical protein
MCLTGVASETQIISGESSILRLGVTASDPLFDDWVVVNAKGCCSPGSCLTFPNGVWITDGLESGEGVVGGGVRPFGAFLLLVRDWEKSY